MQHATERVERSGKSRSGRKKRIRIAVLRDPQMQKNQKCFGRRTERQKKLLKIWVNSSSKQEQWMFTVVHQMQTYVFIQVRLKLARLYLAEN